MKQIVIGLGEIGTAIQSILKCDGYDISQLLKSDQSYDTIHICFPYSDQFIGFVENYKKLFNPTLTIIHSTVPIGTNNKLGSVASPCRGVHPHLEKGIRTFTKYFGGKQAFEAAEIFYDCLIDGECFEDARSVEAMKLWDTTIYGINILIEKEIHRFCVENNLNFEAVYTLANQSYNEGYSNLGMEQYKKYVLEHRDGKIGGHCILPNCELLDSWVSKLILEKQ